MSGNCSLIDPRYSLPFLLSGCSLASPSFFVLDARTSNVFTKECLKWLTNTCRGSLPLLNELNNEIFQFIDPRAQSCFAAPNYWRDLLVQSDTRHQPYLWNMTLLLPKKRFQSRVRQRVRQLSSFCSQDVLLSETFGSGSKNSEICLFLLWGLLKGRCQPGHI